MQVEKITRYMFEAFTKGPTRRDQEFIPFLRDRAEPEAEVEAAPPEKDARQVFEEAYVEGEKAGFEMGMKKAEPLIERLNLYLAEFDSYRNSMMERAEKLAFGLALTFAESIVLRECAEHKDALLRMIKKALELCEQKGKKVIRIKPEDSRFIQEKNPDWTIVPDETLKEPGFVIETDFGDVDGRVSVQLEELRREFLNQTDVTYTPGASEGNP